MPMLEKKKSAKNNENIDLKYLIVVNHSKKGLEVSYSWVFDLG